MTINRHNKDQYWEDRFWNSDDGLKLHYRDYPGDGAKTPIICIPGLTRNARDFAHLGPWLNGKRRILMVDLRGRGLSEYAKDSSSYNPKTYFQDISKLLDELEIASAIFMGTSLGGIITMVTASRRPELIAGAVLNDIGPELDTQGLARIGNYVGQNKSFETWMHVARELADKDRDIHPGYDLQNWVECAKKRYKINKNGRITPDYDLKIAEPFDRKGGGNEALWAALEKLKDKPVLILRGALSDLFTDNIAKKMVKALNKAEYVTVDHVGHAPSLEEPQALKAIDRLIERAG